MGPHFQRLHDPRGRRRVGYFAPTSLHFCDKYAVRACKVEREEVVFLRLLGQTFFNLCILSFPPEKFHSSDGVLILTRRAVKYLTECLVNRA